jgi:hypothetical protein
MTRRRILMRTKPLLVAVSLLLWPLFLLLVTRKSFDADILGWWSWRMFIFVLMATVVVAGATFVLLRLLRNVPDWRDSSLIWTV